MKVIVGTNRNRINVAQTNNIVSNVRFGRIIQQTGGGVANVSSANTQNIIVSGNATNVFIDTALSHLGGIGNATLFVQDTEPTTNLTANSDLWWQSNTGVLKIYYQDANGNVWVDASPPYTTNGGGSSSNNGVYLDISGDVCVANTFEIGGNAAPIVEFTSIVGSTTVNGTPVSLDTFPANQFTTVKYIIQLSGSLGIQSTELFIIQDGVNTYLTEYATLLALSAFGMGQGIPSMGTFSAYISGSNVIMDYIPDNPTSSIINYKIVRNGITT